MEPTGSHHINCDLELLAVLFDNNKGFMWEICKFSDLGSMCYTTAVCYINNMGGSKSPDCNSVAGQIWNYCVGCYTWISASPLPGCENSGADRKSRHFNDRTEWQSHIILLIYQAIWSAKHWFDCISLKKAISSLCLMEAWSRCLEKFQANRALRGDSVGAFLDFLKLVSQIAETNGGSSIDDHSQGNPSDSSRVPESSPIEAKACPLCRDSTSSEAFLREQSILFSIPGANHHRNSMVMHTSENGFSSVLKGKQILFAQL